VKQIIIVDDRLENRYMLEALLKGEEFEIVFANNGMEALTLARKSPPDLIISDILMPVMDGFTLCQEWRRDKMLKRIPFIFYTAAYTSPQDMKYALKLGADRFLIKPQEPEDFLAIIKQVLKDIELGDFVPKPEMDKNETEYLREYNAVLFRTLEDKLFLSEQTERKLNRYSIEIEQAVEKIKELKDDLIQTRNLLDNLIAYGNVPRIICKSTFIIDQFNQAFEKLSGYQSVEVLGRKLNVLFPESVKNESLEQIKKLLNEVQSKPVEIPILTKKGKVRRVLWNFVTVINDEDELINAIAFGEKIPESKVTDQKSRAVTEHLEQSIMNRTTELENSREQLRGLSVHLQNIREEERKHIAREIHDELGHLLTALKLDMERMDNQTNSSGEPLRNGLTPLINLVDAAIDSVRTIATELRPAVLDSFGLIPAMEWQIQQFRIRTNALYAYEFEIRELAFSNDESTAIFRIFQEILTNISRHSYATKVLISFKYENSTLRLRIEDNGIGFDVNKISKVNSFGLLGMSERALSIGGNLSVESIPDIGTTVILTLDKKRNEKNNQIND
jgi:PAS domain S-box-containing protein